MRPIEPHEVAIAAHGIQRLERVVSSEREYLSLVYRRHVHHSCQRLLSDAHSARKMHACRGLLIAALQVDVVAVLTSGQQCGVKQRVAKLP